MMGTVRAACTTYVFGSAISARLAAGGPGAMSRDPLPHRSESLSAAQARHGGRLLRAMVERGERAKPGVADGFRTRPSELLTLDDLGITRSRSSRWQAVADLSDEQAQRHAVEIAAIASRRMAELDPPQVGGRGQKALADASGFGASGSGRRARRSENRDLLAFSEDAR